MESNNVCSLPKLLYNVFQGVSLFLAKIVYGSSELGIIFEHTEVLGSRSSNSSKSSTT